MTGTEGSASQECLEKREPHTPRNNLEYIPAGANLQEAHKRGWKVGNQQANHPEGSVCVWAGGGRGAKKDFNHGKTWSDCQICIVETLSCWWQQRGK